MAQGSPQFTAAQVLEAGQQADSGGNRDYAIQFYRHIMEHHPGSGEAATAREALSRLLGYTASPQIQPRQEQGAQEPTTQPAQATGGYRAREGSSASSTAPVHNGFGNLHATRTSPAPQGPMPAQPMHRQNGLQGSALVPAADGDAAPPIPTQFLVPAAQDHYRTGRFLATLSGLLGWLVLCLGIAAAVAGTGLVPGSAKYIDMVPGLVYGAAGLFAGLLMIFVSQLAQAIFDGANATRDLAAIERAKARQNQSREQQ